MEKKNKENSEKSIDTIIDNTFNKIKDIVDANTIIGNTIKLSDNIFIVPISKVSVGILSGGGQIPSKKQKQNLAIGSSSGFTITPIGFVTISNNTLDFISADTENNTGKLLDKVLNIYEKIVLNNEKQRGVIDENEK